MLPRWCHRLYALVFGYFWLPCPKCGRMFGGHEWDGRDDEPKGTVWSSDSYHGIWAPLDATEEEIEDLVRIVDELVGSIKESGV